MALTHKWSLDEASGTRVDSVGGADGVPFSAEPTVVTGVDGNKALEFSTGTQRLVCGNPADMSFQGDFSISLWLRLKVPSDSNSINCIISKTDAWGLWIGANSDVEYPRGLFFTVGSNHDFRVIGITDIDTSQHYNPSFNFTPWLHVVVVRSSLIYLLYVNGVLVNTSVTATSPVLNTNDVTIGYGYRPLTPTSDYALGYNRYVDEIKVYDTALSEIEAQRDYWRTPDVYLTALDPPAGSAGVSVAKTVDLTVSGPDADIGDIDSLYMEGKKVWGPGYQPGYSGSVIGTRFQFSKDANWFETYIHEVSVKIDNGLVGTSNLTFAFDTETLKAVANSGFEAPDPLLAGAARKWTLDAPTLVGAGESFGRVDTPPNWAPPEGDYALVLGHIAIVGSAPTSAAMHSHNQDIDITIPGELVFSYKVMTPVNMRPGFTWRLRVVIDYSTVLWSRDYTVGDESLTDEGSEAVDISGYTGVHNLAIYLLYDDGVDSLPLFDGATRAIESFSQWPEL